MRRVVLTISHSRQVAELGQLVLSLFIVAIGLAGCEIVSIHHYAKAGAFDKMDSVCI